MNANTKLTLTNITTSIKNPLMLTMKFCPCPSPSPSPSPSPTPPPPSPISSIRSSCRRRRTRSLQPSMVIQDTSTTAASAVSDADTDTDTDTDSLSVSRRLILLRHAKSSWDDRSLRGLSLFLSHPLSTNNKYLSALNNPVFLLIDFFSLKHKPAS